jgi:hypothetical protein
MTAMTTSVDRVIMREGECEVRFAYLTGGPNYTYVPTNNTGATIKIINCMDGDSAYDNVTCSGTTTLTIDTAGVTTTIYQLTYVLYR